MADYSNPTTRLTASRYAYSVTLTRGPVRSGANHSHDTTGTYTVQRNDTVADFLAKISAWYSQTYDVPRNNVVVVRYSLREK